MLYILVQISVQQQTSLSLWFVARTIQKSNPNSGMRPAGWETLR